MPGIFGCLDTTKRHSLSHLADAMASSMMNGHPLKIERFVDDEHGICLGRASLGILNTCAQPTSSYTNRYRVVLHGELYNNPGPLSDSEYILDRFVREGDKCAPHFSGSFSFAIYDSVESEIKIFSDKFGLLPLYFSTSSTGIIFAAEIKSLLQNKEINKHVNYAAFGDLFHCGHVLGQKTLFANIQLLDSASILKFSLKDCKLEISSYWHLADLFAEHGTYNPRIPMEEVVSLLHQSIRKRAGQIEQLGLSLSGGLDSRAILAGLQKDASRIKTYTLGLPGCADERLAQRMSNIAGTKHQFVPLEKCYTEDIYSLAKRMVWLSEGMYLPHEATEILALDYFTKADFGIVLRGHGGEIAKAALAYPVMVTPDILNADNTRILERIFNATNLVSRGIDLKKLLQPSWYKYVNGTAEDSLKNSCEKLVKKVAPGDLCIYYYIRELIRRQVVASLEIFRSQVEIRMPFIDEDFISILLQIPISKRNRGEVHFDFIKHFMPELMSVPDSNTGAPLNSGRLRLLLTDKFNSIMKKLSITGFRHYTEFQKWHREGFKASSEKILFCSRTAERDMYNMDYLKDIFDMHVAGQKNYGHLLGTIIGIELWFRLYVD